MTAPSIRGMTLQELEQAAPQGFPYLKQRLFARTAKNVMTGCWEYLNKRDHHGYGQVGVGKRRLGAHRVAYVLMQGDIPPNHVVMHKCDNPQCVNPAHLQIGTQSQNIQDAVRKQRHRSPGPGGEKAKRPLIAENNNEVLRFPSVLAAHRAGYGYGGIYRSLKNPGKKYRSFSWRYA